MKILLLGEYSKLHNSLKAGLEEHGHQVVLAGDGDGFKAFPVDLSYAPQWTTQLWVFVFLKRLVYRLFHLDLRDTERGIRFYLLLPKLCGYDQVQLINSNAIKTHPRWNMVLLKRLFRQSANVSLLVCGDETPVADYLQKNELRYSVLTPYMENPSLRAQADFITRYSRPAYRRVFELVYQHCTTVITSDIDYDLPMTRQGYNTSLIPNPVISPVPRPEIPSVAGRIIIFLGINRLSYHKKGLHFFEQALAIIAKKYPNRITVEVIENLPYQTYVQRYKNAHIFLDMVYAYDQGYNALEAMAQGKVVFTGAEQKFLTHYKLQEDEVCINALPDVDALVNKISWLIENPEQLEVIGKRAQEFIAREHDYNTIAKRYLNAWESH